jgi:hypothetical protein
VDFWLKVKVWTKLSFFGLLALFALIFIYKNDNNTAEVWFIQTYSTSVLRLLFFTFLFGVAFTLMVRTTFRTIRQIIDMRNRGRTQKLERDLAELKEQHQQSGTPPATPPK